MRAIVWNTTAADDLVAAVNYIDLDRPVSADVLRDTLLAAIERLAMFPDLGRPGRVPLTRELVIPNWPYIIAYKLHHDRVVILRILHAARAWPGRIPGMATPS